MSSHEVIDLKSDIVSARIDGMMCRAEEAGRQEGMEAGMEAGRQEGIAEEKLETARKMLDMDFPIEKIVEITGLSESDILNAG